MFLRFTLISLILNRSTLRAAQTRILNSDTDETIQPFDRLIFYRGTSDPFRVVKIKALPHLIAQIIGGKGLPEWNCGNSREQEELKTLSPPLNLTH